MEFQCFFFQRKNIVSKVLEGFHRFSRGKTISGGGGGGSICLFLNKPIELIIFQGEGGADPIPPLDVLVFKVIFLAPFNSVETNCA